MLSFGFRDYDMISTSVMRQQTCSWLRWLWMLTIRVEDVSQIFSPLPEAIPPARLLGWNIGRYRRRCPSSFLIPLFSSCPRHVLLSSSIVESRNECTMGLGHCLAQNRGRLVAALSMRAELPGVSSFGSSEAIPRPTHAGFWYRIRGAT